MADEQQADPPAQADEFPTPADKESCETLRRRGVDEVCVSSRNSTDFFWSWSRPEPGGRCRIAKTERASGEEGLRTQRSFGPESREISPGRMSTSERAALHFLRRLRIHEMARRQNQRPRSKYFGLPAMRKAEIDDRAWRSAAPFTAAPCISESSAIAPRYREPRIRARPDSFEGLFRVPAKVDERAGCGDGRPADASPAVHANALPGAKAIGQSRYEYAKSGNVGGHVHIENWVGNEVHPAASASGPSSRKPSHVASLGSRSETRTSTPLCRKRSRSSLSDLLSRGTQHDGQANKGISFDPEDIVQMFKLRQTAPLLQSPNSMIDWSA